MGKSVLRVYAVAVYVFLFLPILVVVGAGVQRRPAGALLGGLLDEVVRRGPSRSDDHGAAPDEPRDRRRQCAGRLRPRDDARPRAATHARLAARPDRRARLHDARHAGDRLRDLRADLLRAGRRLGRPRVAARLLVDPRRPRRVQHLRGGADRSRPIRRHGTDARGGLVRPRRRAAVDLSPGDAAAARAGDPGGWPAGVHVLLRRLRHVVLRRRAPGRPRCRSGSSRRCASGSRPRSTPLRR